MLFVAAARPAGAVVTPMRVAIASSLVALSAFATSLSAQSSAATRKSAKPVADAKASTSPAVATRRDSMVVTIEPTKRLEVKLVMKKGQRAEFEWKTDGTTVTYNMHGEVPTDPSVKAFVYQRGASTGEKGTIEAAFDGIHGWSWRNSSEKPVTITVKAVGQFSEMKKL